MLQATWCFRCGGSVRRDYRFCPGCGAEIPPAANLAYPYGPLTLYPPRAKKVPRALRARRGLLACAVALLLLWIPGLVILGILALTVGTTLIFFDRRLFGERHHRDVNLAYGLLWLATIAYILALGAFFWTGYVNWTDNLPLSSIRGATELMVWSTTVPTVLLIIAFDLQVRNLVPEGDRRWLLAAGLLLSALVLAATFLARREVPGTLGSGRITMAAVFGILNRVSAFRVLEAPGFLALAWLYWRARERVIASEELELPQRAASTTLQPPAPPRPTP